MSGRGPSMRMAMVDIRNVGVRMLDRLVPVRMRMRLASIPREIVRVTMMLVVDMGMGMRLDGMHVAVRMTLRNMQPDAERHQRTGEPQRGRERFMLHHQRIECAEERSDGEAGAGACRPQVP